MSVSLFFFFFFIGELKVEKLDKIAYRLLCLKADDIRELNWLIYSGTETNPGWLELPLTRTNILAIEVQLYIQIVLVETVIVVILNKISRPLLIVSQLVSC